MKKTTAFLAGMGAGAVMMFMLDPERGRRRRRAVRDQVAQTGETLRRTSQRVGGTVTGLRESALALLRAGRHSDAAMVARVGVRVARCVSHPKAIQVEADRGVVTLSGPILAGQLESLIRAVSEIPGVERVENRLEMHQTADVPALQNESRQVA